MAARTARVTSSLMEDGVLVPGFTFLSEHQYSYWPSSLEKVACPRHLRDPYENSLVRVATSGVEAGGEGLFARKLLPPGTVVSFYNGVRIPNDTANPHSGTGYCIFVDWGKQLPFPFPWVKEGEMIDIPPCLQSSEDYTATLAHKTNHSFRANCQFTNFWHPCYGLLPAVVTTVEVARGGELSIHYNLNMQVRVGSGNSLDVIGYINSCTALICSSLIGDQFI